MKLTKLWIDIIIGITNKIELIKLEKFEIKIWCFFIILDL